MRYLACVLTFSLLMPSASVAVAATKAVKKKEEPSPAQKEYDRLSLENKLRKQKEDAKTGPIKEQRDEAHVQYDLRMAQQKLQSLEQELEYKRLSQEQMLNKIKNDLQLQALKDEKEELALKNLLALEKEKAALAQMQSEQKLLEAQAHLEAAQQKKKVAALERELADLKIKNELERAKIQEEEFVKQREKNEIDLEIKQLSLKMHRMKFEQEERNNAVAKLKGEISLRENKEEWKKEANRDPDYAKTPFSNGHLTISDRRIPLNGPIYRGVANYVTERIHYFNNEDSSLPIFIVIDTSPGGSVMEGYRIVKAIEASKAPIHVVVKSFAASMAAVIATLAQESYAYPNAIILHHEMSTVNWGNMTMLKEQLELAKKWEARLHGPVSKKIGMSMESFRTAMYKHNSRGDWEEFGDDAQKLKWVKHVVSEIRETGYTKKPEVDEKKQQKWPFGLVEQVDPKGQRYVSLPRLDPYDMYYIFNPDNYYR